MERVPVGFCRDPAETDPDCQFDDREDRTREKVLLQYIWAPKVLPANRRFRGNPDNTINEYDKTNNVQSIAWRLPNTRFWRRPSPLLTWVTSWSAWPCRLTIPQAPEWPGCAKKLCFKENGVLQEITKLTSIVDEETGIPKIDLVFVIDTSGSMGPTWNTCRKSWFITDELTRRGLTCSIRSFHGWILVWSRGYPY